MSELMDAATPVFEAIKDSLDAKGVGELDQIASVAVPKKNMEKKFAADSKAMAENIAEMNGRVKAAEATTVRPEPEEVVAAARAKAVARREQLMAKIAKHKESLKSVEQEIASTASATELLRMEQKKVDQDEGSAVPRTKSILHVYENVSDIKWHYDAPDGKVKGHLVRRGELNELVPFDFDVKEGSYTRHYIVNHLWGLMG